MRPQRSPQPARRLPRRLPARRCCRLCLLLERSPRLHRPPAPAAVREHCRAAYRSPWTVESPASVTSKFVNRRSKPARRLASPESRVGTRRLSSFRAKNSRVRNRGLARCRPLPRMPTGPCSACRIARNCSCPIWCPRSARCTASSLSHSACCTGCRRRRRWRSLCLGRPCRIRRNWPRRSWYRRRLRRTLCKDPHKQSRRGPGRNWRWR